MQEVLRVVVVDDQTSYRDVLVLALSQTPDFEVVGRAADAHSGLEVCLEAIPDLIVTDYRLPGDETGVTLAASLREADVVVPILVLTGFLAPQVVREAEAIDDLHAISKDTSMVDIIESMRTAARGLEPLVDAATPASGLSPGELIVLEMLTEGQTPTVIARVLHLSIHTVRARIKAIHKKLNVGSQGDAIATAIRLGLVVPPQ